MKQHPDQPGANHLYIHAIESSKHPEKALAAADRVRTIMPGVGHMTHMPSHIYERVGRYDESATANRKAIEYDNAYRPFTGPMDFFPMYSGAQRPLPRLHHDEAGSQHGGDGEGAPLEGHRAC